MEAENVLQPVDENEIYDSDSTTVVPTARSFLGCSILYTDYAI